MIDFDDLLMNPEKLLSAYDRADIECNDCIGCENSCCRELSAEIALDSYDIALLKKGLGLSFDEMVEKGYIAIKIKQGVQVPVFGNKPDKRECVFLNDEGRCNIHPWRAGVCRMYPLARLWKGDCTFSYFLQKGECVHRTTKSTVVADWLGYKDIQTYENEIMEYHRRLKEYRRKTFETNEPELKERIKEEFFNENFR